MPRSDEWKTSKKAIWKEKGTRGKIEIRAKKFLDPSLTQVTTLVVWKGGNHKNIALLFVPIKKENSYLVVFFLEVLMYCCSQADLRG